MTNGSKTWVFEYDSNGMRTGRTDGTTTYTYLYSNGLLTQMTKNGAMLYFTYDAAGIPLTVQYNGIVYYYVTNLQGDVVAILDGSGHAVVEYLYNAWGVPILTTFDSSSTDLYTVNPLYYRGYIYDTETYLYYLQSRYYDPAIGRFISADNYPSTGQGLTGNNMFAYCGNNPVSRNDEGGEFWHIVIGAVVGATIGVVTSAIGGGDLTDCIIGGLAGAAGGALAATGAGVVWQALGSAAISMASNAAGQYRDILQDDTGKTKFDVGDMLFDGAVGLICGIAGGNGASYGNTGGINAAWKQFGKRWVSGDGFDAAFGHFVKQAHRIGGDFVLEALSDSLHISAIGSYVITAKNLLKG